MGASTTAKRAQARGTSSPSSHLPYEVIGVVLITLSLLILLGLLSYAPSDATFFSTGSPSTVTTAPPTRNMIGTVGASLASGLFWLIGTAAYLLPALLTVIGSRCFVHDAPPGYAAVVGNVTVKVLPLPSSLSTVMRPPYFATIL